MFSTSVAMVPLPQLTPGPWRVPYDQLTEREKAMLNSLGRLGVWTQDENELCLHYSSIVALQWKTLKDSEGNPTSRQISEQCT